MMLEGSRTHSGEVRLPAGAPHQFQRGRRDVFELQLADLGVLEKMRVGHDCKGADKSWHLDRVTVQDKTAGLPPATFACGE